MSIMIAARTPEAVEVVTGLQELGCSSTIKCVSMMYVVKLNLLSDLMV